MVAWLMFWAFVREGWRRGLPLLGAVVITSLLLRGFAMGSEDEAIQAAQTLSMFGLMPLLGVMLGGARVLDADVTWLLARPIPRWWLVVSRIATDIGILAACLLISLVVLGVPIGRVPVEIALWELDLSSPSDALVISILVHGSTAAFTATGRSPLAAAALGVFWLIGMLTLPYAILSLVRPLAANIYTIVLAYLGIRTFVLVACFGLAWATILVGARRAPLSAALSFLVRWSIAIQVVCATVQAAAVVYDDLHRDESGVPVIFEGEQPRAKARGVPGSP